MFVHGDAVGDPRLGAGAQVGIGAAQIEVAWPDQREIDVAHRRERDPQEELQPRARRLDEHLDQDVLRNVVRGRPRRPRRRSRSRAMTMTRRAPTGRMAGSILAPFPTSILRTRTRRMTRTRSVVMATTLGLIALAGAIDQAFEQRGGAAPAYAADPLWPKPLPNNWILGSVTGVAVDSRDHIWIVHRGMDFADRAHGSRHGHTPPTSEICCSAAPAVLEFDASRRPREPLGRTWPGLRVARVARWHRGRCERQRLDRRRWASMRPAGGGRGGRAGGAAPAAPPPPGRRARAQVLARREVPPADRQARRVRRQQQPDDAQSSRPTSTSITRPTRCSSPTASARIGAWSCSTP